MYQGKNKLIFRNLEITDRQIVDRAVRYADSMSCQVSFANLYCLSCKYNTKICISEGVLYIRQSRRDENLYEAYLLPMKIPEESSEGESDHPLDWFHRAIGKIREEAHSAGKLLMFFGVTEDMKELVLEEETERFHEVENRDWADYIYLSEKMISLSGSRLAAKRKAYNKFMREYAERITISEIKAENIEEVREFQKNWMENNNKTESGQSLVLENRSINIALDSFEALGLKGIVIYIDNRVAAYSYGQPVTDKIFDVIVEKGDYRYPNIYRVINRFFVVYCCKKYKYINREEDIGLTGLRQAKMRYQPEILLKKYNLYEYREQRSCSEDREGYN